MGETLSAQQLLAAGASGALMVLFGAFYALFFTINHIRPARYWPLATISSFLLLTVCSVVLVIALKLDLFWQAVVAFVLICYYFSPRFIWRLCVATHADDPIAKSSDLIQTDSGGS